MPSTRLLLPPQFLLPSWTPIQLQCFQVQVPLTQKRSSSSRSTSQSPPKSPSRQSLSPRNNKSPTPSLFETLFPEDAYAKKRSARRLDKLPAFEWHVDLPPSPLRIRHGHRDIEPSAPGSLKNLRNVPVFSGKTEGGIAKGENRPSVLLLSALTKTLEESDFFRLSPRGDHIEGWSSGIIKVIQARDSHTLSPLSFYFILFTSHQHCTNYRDTLLRLHSLSKIRGFISKSNASTSPNPTSTQQIPLPPQNPLLKEGEDIDTLLAGFSLVPPSGRLSMRILKEPFTPFIHAMVERGLHSALVKQKETAKDGQALVLLTTSTGRFTESDILDSIQKDTRRRNLEWRLAGGKRDIERLNDRVIPLAVSAEYGRENIDVQDDDDVKETEELYAAESKTKGVSGQARFRSRFVIAFRDRHEARRFVREWHRTPLPGGGWKGMRDGPVVDVQILW